MQHRSRFGVVIGMDGSGKSTLLEKMAQQAIHVVDWKDLKPIEEVAFVAPDNPREIRAKLKPLTRAMFVASHLAAEYEYLVEPALLNGQSVLLDSYYFRWVAKETLFGKTDPLFFSICAELPKPDLLVLLDIAPEVAFQRRGGIVSPSECFVEPTLDDFSRFQRCVIEMIVESAGNIPILTINADQDPALVQQDLLAGLAEHGWDIPALATAAR